MPQYITVATQIFDGNPLTRAYGPFDTPEEANDYGNSLPSETHYDPNTYELFSVGGKISETPADTRVNVSCLDGYAYITVAEDSHAGVTVRFPKSHTRQVINLLDRPGCCE